jgi:tetratricopeptide (TPR) repeat protein
MATRIDLGLTAAVRLGRLLLHPAVRVIRRDDGAEEIVEPRVMQVLLALADGRGEIVRREELTERCWEGRIVGEDAINRVLSRLRRVAEGIGEGSFRIDTVTRVGYRLTELGGPPSPVHLVHSQPAAAVSPGEAGPASGPPTRRTLLLGAAAAGGLALAGGGAWWRLHRAALPVPARLAIERGVNGLRMASPDQLVMAVAAFREAIELAPDAAEPWGLLAFACRWLCMTTRGQEGRLNAERAREAAETALRLDPGNADAQAVLAVSRHQFGNWLAYDAACRPVIGRHPDTVSIGVFYIDMLSNVGRIREINALVHRFLAKDADWLFFNASLMLSSYCLGRLDEADAAMDMAARRWPQDIGAWFIRQRILAYSGRPAIALAMIADVDHRPVGVPAWNFDLAEAETRALLTRSKADVDKAASLFWDRAHKAVGEAFNAAGFFAAIGRLDEAFAILDAVYFSRGFDVGERSYSEEQGGYADRRDRKTWYFWMPYMAGLRADPRAGKLMRELGLAEYWRKSGTGPDFPVAGL